MLVIPELHSSSLGVQSEEKWRDDGTLRWAGRYCPSRAEVTIHPYPLSSPCEEGEVPEDEVGANFPLEKFMPQ